jgi:hypothetical protein
MPIDEEFELRCLEFKMNCNDGDGDGMACHSLGKHTCRHAATHPVTPCLRSQASGTRL